MTPRTFWVRDALWEQRLSTDTLVRVWTLSEGWETHPLVLTRKGLERIGARMVATC